MSSRSDTRMGTLSVVSEAWRVAVSAPVASGMLLIVVAAVVGSILATTGQTVRAEQDVLARIDEAGTRLIVVSDVDGSGHIPNDAVDRIAALSRVDWAFGVGYAVDARNSAIGNGATPAAVRTMWGGLPDVIDTNGRTPQPGEAIAGIVAADTLGLAVPVGGIDTRDIQLAVVGGFTASDPLQGLNTSLLAEPGPEAADALVRSVYVLAETPDDVALIADAVPTVLGAEDPFAIALETSETLADVRAAVAGELGRFSRSLIAAVLAAGLILTTLIVYASVTARRQDFGRRRALGATRGVIVGLVVTQTTLLTTIGIAIGTAVGTALTIRWTTQLPDTEFLTAIASLTLLASIIAATPPAVLAAWRDPVHVLRVP
ncbi:MAG: FtsX-like permease family protein [Actinomycetota bacterium]